MSTETINICIPVFNEERNLENLYKELSEFVSSASKKLDINFEIIFFDDGSTDDSRRIIESFRNAKLIFNHENKGLGNAIKQLILYTKSSEAIGMFKIDGDGQMDIKDIEIFLKNNRYKKYDVIYGNRFHKKSNYKMPFLRRFGSIFFKLLMRLFSIKTSDPTNGFIYLSKKYVENSKIIGNYNAAQQILLDAKLRNLKTNEVDINLNIRSSGVSFIGIKYPIIVTSNLIALYVYKKTVRTLIAPGIISLLIGLLILIYDVYLWATGVKEQIITDQILILFIIFGAQLSITGFLIEIFKGRSD
tara:strand:- start:417 stop:1325 length:909 start_codon:yes stop_codon:yes gene_type:complete